MSASPPATPTMLLLGHADVEEAVREPLRERLQHGVAQVAGQEPDPRVGLRDGEERLDERAPHAPTGSPPEPKRLASCASSGDR